MHPTSIVDIPGVERMEETASAGTPLPGSPPPGALTGWERVSRLFSYAFARHDAGEEVDAPVALGRSPVARAVQRRCTSRAAVNQVSRLHNTHHQPLQVPPMPDEFREWAQDTLLATFAGMLFGGGKRWAEERSAGGLLVQAQTAP